jgi:putative Ca2+/H+ antiporter (TMEM165/GDT1 family)
VVNLPSSTAISTMFLAAGSSVGAVVGSGMTVGSGIAVGAAVGVEGAAQAARIRESTINRNANLVFISFHS